MKKRRVLIAVLAVALTGGAEGPEGSSLCSVFFILAIARIGARRTGRGSR